MKVQYQTVVDKIKDLASKWIPTLGLNATIQHYFHETVSDEDDTIIADTKGHWEYRSFQIHWYLPKAVQLDDDELEATLVHELAHCLIHSIQEFIKPSQHGRFEYATENVARALLGSVSNHT